MDVNNAVAIYVDILTYVLPFALVVNIGQLLVNMVFGVAFGGKLKMSFR